jgi:putative hydrolase of the HAD superfamily
MAIRTIIFDFGRVIGHFDHRVVSQRLSAHSDLAQPELHAILFGSQLEDDYEAGRLGTDAFLERVETTCRLRCSRAELITAYSDMFWLNDEVCSLVPRLKPSYRLLLLSNTNDLHARQFLPQFREVLAHFDALILSHEVGARKPSAAVYSRCQQLAACSPEECVFIDDLAANVAGARTFGWHGIVYTNIADLRRRLTELGVGV